MKDNSKLYNKLPFKLQGYSTSETWYAVLDYGTNYCNLRNLIEGRQIYNVIFTERVAYSASYHHDLDFSVLPKLILCNIILGAGLDKVSGFGESTSDSICTQYSSHNCTVY